jgi:uncharacterized protein (DUF1697 family)
MGDQAMDATVYVAFLRAINVGGRVVKMTELVEIFEQLGLDDVSTFIASGNVIFSSRKAPAALATLIETGLQRALGYSVATMLRSTSEVASVANHQAFAPAALAGASLYVGFMREGATPAAVKKALALGTGIDELRVAGREVYWLARKNISEASITGAAIEKALQTPVTFRNINTVRRLAAKYPG